METSFAKGAIIAPRMTTLPDLKHVGMPQVGTGAGYYGSLDAPSFYISWNGGTLYATCRKDNHMNANRLSKSSPTNEISS